MVSQSFLSRHNGSLTGADFIPIPGTKAVKRLQENADAAKVDFTKEDNQKFRGILDQVGGAKGSRYPASLMSSCFGDSPELDEA
jgi:aryl-alcohol dehydrogenase-like predicted oxidoreductase